VLFTEITILCTSEPGMAAGLVMTDGRHCDIAWLDRDGITPAVGL